MRRNTPIWQDTLVEESLVAHLGNDVAPLLREDDHVVQIGALADELRILHRLADAEETLGPVDVETGVRHGHLRGLDRIELANLGPALAALAVLRANPLVVGDGILHQMLQLVAHLLGIGLDLLDLDVGLLRVVTGDADELQFRQALHVLERHLAAQQLLEGLQPLVDGCIGLLARAALLHELVKLVFDEDPLERRGMPGGIQLLQPNLQLAPEEVFRVVGRTAQNLRHPEEMGFVVVDHAGVRGDRHLAVREGVEGVDGLVRGLVGGHLNDDLHLLGRIVVHLADLDLPFSLAFLIDSLIDSEVVVKGISVIASVRLSIFEMRARTFTAPPRRPSL